MPPCARVARSIPLLDQILICPSSPTVTNADPSGDHRRDVMAPLCASIVFSVRPAPDTSRNFPSVHATATRSAEEFREAPLPPSPPPPRRGYQCMSVGYTSAGNSPAFRRTNDKTNIENDEISGRQSHVSICREPLQRSQWCTHAFGLVESIVPLQ